MNGNKFSHDAAKENFSILKLVHLASLSATTLSIGLSFSAPAFAQAKIEQMIVTATKRSQDVQSVPASISAFSGEGLAERQINTVQDLTQATPNLTLAYQSSTVATVAIRGVSTDSFTMMTDGAVALHVDGVYQPRTGNLLQTMFDLDSIELLRGPQGTLYGRNANAGVINFNTAKPTNVFEGSATLFGGSFNRYGAKGYVSGPVANGISMRVSGMVDRDDGYGTNLVNGDSISGVKSYGGRFSVRMKPTDDVTIDLVASGAFTKSTNGVYLGTPAKGINIDNLRAAGSDTRQTLDPWKAYLPYAPDFWTKEFLTSATVVWDICNELSIKSISGWQGFNSHGLTEYGLMPIETVNSLFLARSHTFSQEFDVNAKLWDRVDVVGGLYYMKDIVRGGNISDLPLGYPMTPNVPGNISYTINQQIDQVTTAKAAFFDVTLNVTDQLRVIGGIRRSFDYRGTVQHDQAYFFSPNTLDTGLMRQGLVVDGCTEINHVVPDQDYAATTGKLGLQFDFTPNITGYVSWQNGFKDGGYNVAVCDDSYEPERIYSWEVGLKGSYFDDALNLNIALFDYRYSNMQVSRVLGVSGTIDNAASSKLRGMELEATAYLTNDLKADLALGVLDSKYGPLQSRNAVIPSNPLVDLTGFQLPRAPKISLSAGLEYTMRVGDFGELKARGEYSYTSLTYYTIFNEDLAKQDGYSLVNAILTFTPDNSYLSFRFFARNILDKAYKTGVFSSGGLYYNSDYSWAAPRTFGGEVTAKF